MNIREIVKSRMEEKKLKPLDLVRLMKWKVPQATLYEFISGRGRINSDYLGEILEALELGVTANEENK